MAELMDVLLQQQQQSQPQQHPREERRAQLKRYVESEVQSMRPYLYLTRAFAVASVIAVIAFIYAGIDNNAFSSVLFFQLVSDYGAVIDAGSHGSRLHLYQWPARIHDPDHPLSGPISLPVEIFSLRAVPGISATVDDGGDASRTGELCIGPLLDQLKIVLIKLRVPQEQWADIPVFVKATAGMRDLDSVSRSAIMNSIRAYIANETPFLFHWSWARITAGEEEGVYGWLTVNSALGTLLMPAGETFGAMDLGGASMQITYAPLRTSVLESYYGLSLGGQSIHLYSHSFLGYGWGDSMTRLTTRLAVESVVETLQAEGFDELHFDALLSYLLSQQEALADATADLIFPPTMNHRRYLQDTSSLDDGGAPPEVMMGGDKAAAADDQNSAEPLIIGGVLPAVPMNTTLNATTVANAIANSTKITNITTTTTTTLTVDARIIDDAHTLPVNITTTEEEPEEPSEEEEEGGDDDVGAPKPPHYLSADPAHPVLVHIRAIHPCYPIGHAFQFYLPTLVQPEGRLFLDVDMKRLVSYMRFTGIPDSYLEEIVSPKIKDPVGGNQTSTTKITGIIQDAIDRAAAGGSVPRRRLDTSMPTKEEQKQYHKRIMAFNMASMLLDEFDPLHYADPNDNGDGYGNPPKLASEHGLVFDNRHHRRSLSSTSDHLDSLFGNGAAIPFRPLTKGLPSPGAPRVQYVIDFEGSSDPDACRARARDMFYDLPCFVHSCSFNGVYQPSKEGSQFIAFGQFSRVQQALNSSSATASPAELATLADEVCSLSRAELEAGHRQGKYLPYGKNGVMLLCWKSLWTYTVLNWGYGFPANSTQITFAQTVGAGPSARAVGWADGSMIVEVNNFPWKTPLGRFEIPFVLASVLALLFAITTWLVMIQLRSRGRIIKLAGLDPGRRGRRTSAVEGGYVESAP